MTKVKKVNNLAEIVGKVEEGPTYSYTSKVSGVKMYESKVSVMRPSGKYDIVPLIMSESLADIIKDWDRVKVIGSMRTFSRYNEEKQGYTTSVYIYVTDVYNGELLSDRNMVKFIGSICKEPKFKKSSIGKDVCDFIVAVNTTSKHSDYIPSVAWQAIARKVGELSIGDKVYIGGRFNSRYYSKEVDGEFKKLLAFEASCYALKVLTEEEEYYITEEN